MPGDGTKAAITTDSAAAPPARCIDITRLIRRAGRPMTGVDRVEFAYLRALVADAVPVFALARTRQGYVLLAPEGAAEILRRAGADEWGPLDALGRFLGRVSGGSEIRRRAEADLRRNARARTLPHRLGAMLQQHLPAGISYLNTGHSNLTDRVISALRCVRDARISVLVHDTIPLDFPQYQRPETQVKFKAFLGRVARHADLVIANSAVTRADFLRHCEAFGRLPECIVAPLGIELAQPADLPNSAFPDAPYFVCVSTIEPRKNHALLLDIWDSFAEEGRKAPYLLICGGRGWNNDAVFARLDRGNPLVQERPGLSDGEISALLARSCGLVFPSLAEGYGLPPVEAAALGVPVICSDLEIFRETLADIPIYPAQPDVYSWRKVLEQVQKKKQPRALFHPPNWDSHFNIVLSSV
ncbi:glycosyltransferase family 1 protein [Marinovum sp. 2_MG-2023]|uniref:glycosyltransferase family 4 protein n=1 Tax=unclassified Marinovum TaxID=2647166 RepID=UPI0026E46259|nr:MULTISPECIES: glycosyltransferase family 1 protein [unclassified Marinovum]MDO6732340.1 glycosyltransferase family 1 protein [Marinovum sp. 2_MG-2023]MDO6781657.1 glycosyltransferase family 1 protein [Marinovum sp. 1_MG-2023]